MRAVFQEERKVWVQVEKSDLWVQELEVSCAQALSAGRGEWQEMELLRWTVARL